MSPQAFEWEKLRAPVLVEDFTELRARLALLPPPVLRPRRMGEDFHVLPVAANSPAVFDPASQRMTSVLTDAGGARVQLALPWHSRGAAGMTALGADLRKHRAVCIRTRFPDSRRPDHRTRRCRAAVRTPAHDPAMGGRTSAGPFEAAALAGSTEASPLPESWQECGELLADLLVTGTRSGSVEAWSRLAETAAVSGAIHCGDLAGRIAAGLRCRREGLSGASGDIAAALGAWRMAVDNA